MQVLAVVLVPVYCKTMSAEQEPLAPIVLRDAYVHYFGAIATMGATAAAIEATRDAAGIITSSQVPYAQEADACARLFAEYLEGAAPAAEDTGVDIMDDPAETIIGVMAQSWAFSRLAVDCSLILAAAKTFGKDISWTRHLTDAWQRDFTDVQRDGEPVAQAEIDDLSHYMNELYKQVRRRQKQSERSHRRAHKEQWRQQRREGIL